MAMKLEPTSDGRITRRTILSGAFAGALSAVTGVPAFGQQLQTYRPPGVTPKPKGTVVFLDYDQDELDNWSTQSLWAPNQGELEKRNAQKSAQAVARLAPHVGWRTVPRRPRNSTSTSRKPRTHRSISSSMAEPGEPVARHQRRISRRCSSMRVLISSRSTSITSSRRRATWWSWSTKCGEEGRGVGLSQRRELRR